MAMLVLFLHSGRSSYLYVVYHIYISTGVSGHSELISQQEFLLQLCKKLRMWTHWLCVLANRET